jgi:hypothetical protein
MVDPNPARGMPAALQRYWLAGKGAAKIRWGIPHDFDRCVRNLRKYFPKNPSGLCNILHQKALGAPPGKGHGHSITASMHGTDDLTALIAAQTVLDMQPHLGRYLWAGPLAPIGRPTGEPRRTRVFEPGALYHRALPLPLDWREKTGQGHEGAVTVGRILGISYGPDHDGLEFCWAYGDYLDEDVFPDAKKARMLAEGGVAGPSLDPGGKVQVTVNPETGFEHMTLYGIGGATMVSIPAFAALRQTVFEDGGDWPDDDPDMAIGADDDCGCADASGSSKPLGYGVALGPVDAALTVNPSGWRGLPLAPRNSVFDNDDAVKRIAAWASTGAQGPDVDKLRRAFMWYDPQLSPTDPTSYRLPVGDIINGRLTLIFHAIYAAAALLSGAHGGLPGIDEKDRAELRGVISEIYPEMATAFNDSSVRAPWDRSAAEGVQLAMAAEEPYGDVKYADPGYRDNQKRYPIDTPEHIRAAWAYINVAKNAAEYDAKQLAKIKSRIMAAAKKAGVDIAGGNEQAMMNKPSLNYATTGDGYPLEPPAAWFEDPKLTKKTKLTVTDEGRVYGHLAAWNECHRDVTMRECVMAPKSEQQYAPFHLGAVYTAEGDLIEVGKIVQDTRHAHIGLGYAAAALHYDNTGDEIAVVRAGEDQFGIYVAGAVVPEATRKKVAKLRRSPLSGDWRRENGSLELTAALAVNAPAFPVYAMENDERLALVAAGSVWADDFFEEDEPLGQVEAAFAAGEKGFTAPPTGIQDPDRQQRFKEIFEDEEIYEARLRQERFQQLFAADDQAVVPVPAAPAASGAPEMAAQGEDPSAVALAEQMNARFAIIPDAGAEAAPVAEPVPATPAQ